MRGLDPRIAHLIERAAHDRAPVGHPARASVFGGRVAAPRSILRMTAAILGPTQMDGPAITWADLLFAAVVLVWLLLALRAFLKDR
jgi:hypothetical protein